MRRGPYVLFVSAAVCGGVEYARIRSVGDFEYIRSCGAHGHHAMGSFDAFVGSQREIWVGDDGSGLIRESSGPVSFFTDEGRAQWQAAGSPSLEYGPSMDLFAPRCLGGSRARRARLRRDAEGLQAALVKYSTHLHAVQELLAEGVVEADVTRAAYGVASRLQGVEVVHELVDQLGRIGTGLVEVRGGERVELIFSADRSELLGYRHVLVEPRWFAPAGALHSWASYLERAVVDDLPRGTPPVPNLPCEPPFSGRGFPIRPGFSVMTGYVTDAVAQLTRLHDQGVITDAEYDTAVSDQNAG